jgi:hypothetical protein
MSKKSIPAILKTQILDSGLPVQERRKALRRLSDAGRASRRFLESLVRNQSVHVDVRRDASRLLVSKIATPKPARTSPSTSELENVETVTESNVIDPEIWDLVGGVPGCVRGETSLKAARSQFSGKTRSDFDFASRRSP